ncbi:hypothetical protein AV530_003738 [Patagioenas fasciata monilis]|uniref:Uncharacterized protein n=1 Tax=Patagioenas fasciata monilis TaxID=372326 RepID=A0A1V4KYQ9_PATFA|nr:hypothetical protein AV530_003738 [Patagioenas fasciata monilis]
MQFQKKSILKVILRKSDKPSDPVFFADAEQHHSVLFDLICSCRRSFIHPLEHPEEKSPRRLLGTQLRFDTFQSLGDIMTFQTFSERRKRPSSAEL